MVLDSGRFDDRALDDRVVEEESVLDSELDRFRVPSASSSCCSSSIMNLFRMGAWSRQLSSSRPTAELKVSIFSQLLVRLCK